MGIKTIVSGIGEKMDNKIQIFNFQSQEVRVVMDEENNPWWVAKDICEILDIKETHRALSGVDDDEKGSHIVTTPGGNQSMSTVNEPGLYSLILNSRKPEAKVFKRWVTHDMIPSVRKTGSYSIQPKGTDALIAQAEMLLSSMKQMKEIELRQAEFENKQTEQEVRLLEVESAIADLPDPHYKTVVGYANEHYISVPLNAARIYGKMCTQYSKALGYPIENVPHPLYGTVHAYHEDILRRVVR